jgi:hypothetical protein
MINSKLELKSPDPLVRQFWQDVIAILIPR